jgi:hypothetical protein
MSSKRDRLNMCFVIGACAVAALATGSCDTFSTRVAEEPEGEATQYVVPQDPVDVLSNLENAVRDRDTEIYAGLFTDDFVFIADPSDVIEVENFYPGAFDNWDIAVETHVGERILDQSRTTISGVDFTAETLVGETDSTYEVLKDYQLFLRREAYESFDIYIGTARFSMRVESDGLWYIHKWEDARRDTGIVADKDTWGKLKGETRATS